MNTKLKFLLIGTAVLGLIIAVGLAATRVTPALADINGCPNGGIGNPQESNLVGAHFETDGNIVTYYFSSFVNRNPADGVPGLIEYCIYPDPATQPDEVVTLAVGADGGAWTEPWTFDNFSFQRPDGNPSNIPFDGRMDYKMGTATWNDGVPAAQTTLFAINGATLSDGVPATQTILLHINDAAECDRLYGGNPGTCFVLPGEEGPFGKDLTVTKTATPSFTRTYNWDISKDVTPTLVKQIGGTATFNYTVNVWQYPVNPITDDSDWAVVGKINVHNPNIFDVSGVDVTDDTPGGTCTVIGGTGLTVLAGGDKELDYSCTFASKPPYDTDIINTATATWDKDLYNTLNDSASGTADFAFTTPTTTVNKTVTVYDTFNGNPPERLVPDVTATDKAPWASHTWTYPRTVNVPTWDCVFYPNIATVVDAETGNLIDSAPATIEVCGPAKTGALTMGFWQNKNGQAIITGQATTGVCPSATWLRQYAPFQDLIATATCVQVGTYVTNIIKAANASGSLMNLMYPYASGSSMNAMLKAQMLATALDVYFSDPALGGNKIGAPAPIGGVAIDLTKICKNIAGGCTIFENVSSAFGGASSMTISQMLAYAASQSNVGGSLWYGQVKAMQELAKDAFDAINNQKVFAP
jgi:hypothetical protein